MKRNKLVIKDADSRFVICYMTRVFISHGEKLKELI